MVGVQILTATTRANHPSIPDSVFYGFFVRRLLLVSLALERFSSRLFVSAWGCGFDAGWLLPESMGFATTPELGAGSGVVTAAGAVSS